MRQPQALPKATVSERKDITHDLAVFKLKPEMPFTFKPGQYATLGINGIERAYSIVSAPHEPFLEVFVELVPHGELTPFMWNLKAGDCTTIRPRAKGIFTMDPNYPNQVMVCTVTGVAPFVSMIRSYLHQKSSGHHFYLLQGASFIDEFTYKDEMESLARQCPHLITYVPSCSRPNEPRNAGWQGAKGRVNLIVEEYVQRWELDTSNTIVYACGHPGMIEDVRARMSAKSFKVKEERFWKE